MILKKALVTGGAGFLGSHMCELLLATGYQVICIDNLSTSSMQHIEPLFQHPQFKFIRHDVVHPLEIDYVDEIYNFACPASPVQYQKNPIQTLKTSVYGAVNVLDLAQRFNAKILHMSTSEIYGDPLEHPQRESYFGHVNPVGLRACYDEGKRAAETLFFDYRRQYNINIKIARLFNVYGPRMQMNDGRVIPNFILQALQNQPITIYSDGKQTRSFCFVADTLRGLQTLMATANDFTGPVNLGNTIETTMLELADTIINLTGSKSPLKFQPKPQDDPVRRRPDISLAKANLNWQPNILLQDGLKHTIIYFQNLLTTTLARAV